MGVVHEYIAEAQFHGVPPIVTSKDRRFRLLWAVTVVIFGVLLTVQIGQLVQAFLNDHSGTHVTQWIPQKIPKLHFCPIFYLDNRRIAENLPGLPNVTKLGEGLDLEVPVRVGTPGLIHTFMDSFVGVGGLYKSMSGVSNVMETANFKTDDAKFITPFVQGIYRSSIGPKYNNSLHSFLDNNSYTFDEIISKAEIFPAITNMEHHKDVSWEGVCHYLSFNANVSRVQLQYVHVDVHFVNMPNPLYGVQLVEKVENAMYFGVGEPSYMGISDTKRTRLRQNHSYVIDIRQKRYKYRNSRSKPCIDDAKGYPYEAALRCLMKGMSDHACKTCKMAIPTPDDRLDIDNHCSYFYGNGHECFEEMFTVDPRALPEPCAPSCSFDEYTISVGRPQYTPGHSSVRITFRNVGLSTMLREYRILTVSGMLSNLGGILGLYFGASVLSLFHVVMFWGGKVGKRKTAKVEEVSPQNF